MAPGSSFHAPPPPSLPSGCGALQVPPVVPSTSQSCQTLIGPSLMGSCLSPLTSSASQSHCSASQSHLSASRCPKVPSRQLPMLPSPSQLSPLSLCIPLSPVHPSRCHSLSPPTLPHPLTPPPPPPIRPLPTAFWLLTRTMASGAAEPQRRSFETLRVMPVQGRVLHVELNRPEKRNAMNGAFWRYPPSTPPPPPQTNLTPTPPLPPPSGLFLSAVPAGRWWSASRTSARTRRATPSSSQARGPSSQPVRGGVWDPHICRTH